MKPFLYNRLSVTARYADNRYLKLFTVLFRQLLQSLQRIGDHKEINS